MIFLNMKFIKFHAIPWNQKTPWNSMELKKNLGIGFLNCYVNVQQPFYKTPALRALYRLIDMQNITCSTLIASIVGSRSATHMQDQQGNCIWCICTSNDIHPSQIRTTSHFLKLNWPLQMTQIHVFFILIDLISYGVVCSNFNASHHLCRWWLPNMIKTFLRTTTEQLIS